MRWGRIVLGAVLIEAVLLVIAVPLIPLLSNPFTTPDAPRDGFTTFFAAVAVACLVAGAVGGWWAARPLASGLALHGALTGIAATAIYLGICSIPPTTIPAVFNAYGPLWFVAVNGLRIVGAALGATYLGSRRRA